MNKPPTETNQEKFEHRDQWIASVTPSLLTPTYEHWALSVKQLNQASQAFCEESPSEMTTDRLAVVQEAWKQSMRDWAHMQFLTLTPNRDILTYYAVHHWPNVRASSLDRQMQVLIEKEQAVTANDISGSLARQGLPPIEWLLFSAPEDRSVLASFKDPNSSRCEVLLIIASLLDEHVSQVNSQWQNKALDFAQPAETEGGFTDSALPTKLVINGISNVLETTRRYKLLEPLGSSAQAAKPNTLEAFRSEFSINLLRENLQFLDRLMKGENEQTARFYGLYQMLADQSDAELVEQLKKTLQDVQQKANNIARLETALDGPQRQDAQALLSGIIELKQLIDSQLFAAMGVKQDAFNESDGD
ncbi:MAG: imelysin family protein [Pseudomonadota bacterium]|nr:imelysin family protein [Pseudomonadota bacterium]